MVKVSSKYSCSIHNWVYNLSDTFSSTVLHGRLS